MAPKKVEICPLSGGECSRQDCKGSISFESRNPAVLAVSQTTKMCGSIEIRENDSYVEGVREDVMRMHERVLRYTQRPPYEEELRFGRNY